MNETEFQATGKEHRHQGMESKGLFFACSPKCCKVMQGKKSPVKKNLNKTKNPKPTGFLVKLSCEYNFATFLSYIYRISQPFKGPAAETMPSKPPPHKSLV